MNIGRDDLDREIGLSVYPDNLEGCGGGEY